jgi:hypothetical protein
LARPGIAAKTGPCGPEGDGKRVASWFRRLPNRHPPAPVVSRSNHLAARSLSSGAHANLWTIK